MSSFGDWIYSVDRDATLAAYRAAEDAGSKVCACNGCRNFLLARANVFPETFLVLLDQLGIDPKKDAEVYHMVRLTPGRHHYGGWFHFIGSLSKTGDFAPVAFGDGFTAWMCQPSAPRLSALQRLSVVQVEFDAKTVPWLLPEPEAD